MFAYAGLLLAGTLIVGQTENVGPHYQYLKDLEFFVGDWTMEGELNVTGDYSGLADIAGQKMSVVFPTAGWPIRISSLQTFAEGEDSPLEYAAAIGWDPLKKQIRSWDVNSQGGHLEYVHIKKENGWVIEGTSVYPGGVEGTYRAENTIIDKDTVQHRGKGIMKQDGKESEVKLSFTMRRVQAADK